ncbi:regulatory protein GemA [Parablautia sp. Marseille-Q6255]|uniref:regulatory protein GemA n=1 Tax=Parablautia sp. Marseille-Q6255 TaxID=3039593 RepID=UPI0024BCF843|nr:regulatory protein GemA [Parablautia sp. Marseille-Q6255]
MAGSTNPSIRTIWGLAKCDELRMTDEELHLVVMAQTGKESIRKLTKKEITRVVYVLSQMKESSRRGREVRTPQYDGTTQNQRRKVYKLMQSLGWNEKRINGMCRRMFKIDRLEWLNYKQISDLIEALKAMLNRQEEKS